MKVYRVLKLDGMGKLLLDGVPSPVANPIEIRHKIKHKLKWKPQKMLRKMWGFWL